MWQRWPMALLLLVSAGTRAANLTKAMVSLDPPWDRVLEKDNVTLTCGGAYPPEDKSTQWFHNGNRLPHQTSSYFIAAATVADSGAYSCQTDLLAPSEPVQLKVHAGWLLLQAPRWVLQAGEPLRLRCHSWKNVLVRKVQYFRDGRGQKFSCQNSEFHVPKATHQHSGSYFCRGIIGTLNVSSEAVTVTVQAPAAPAISPFFTPWTQITFCLVTGLMFAVDTGLYVSAQRELRSSLRNRRNGKVTWSKIG